MTKKIGYLGPAGTFSEMAVLKSFSKDSNSLFSFPTIEAVFDAVSLKNVDIGVVPIENSYEGTVNETLDLLAYEYDLKIVGEVILPIKQNLLALPGTFMEDILHIVSHPQALAQCRRYISQKYPAAKQMTVPSTAEAAQTVSQGDNSWAAIGTLGAATAYGLEVLASDINDHPNNETRFLLLATEELPCDTDCKTSLLVNVLNKPGALLQSLKEFSLRGINLTKIESRPAKTTLGDYLFFIDLDGHSQEPKIKDSIMEIAHIAQAVKVLGSYQAAKGQKGHKSVFDPSLDYLRQEVDIIDAQIIELLGRRTKIVEKIGIFKENAGAVHDPKREQLILEKLSRLAEEKGFDKEVTKKVYQILFQHFVSLQKAKK
ncbi:MAG: prephenate dehydratase [Bacillota bacterium]|nr:prephenate dehydratase [Bacillota bacterium]